MNEISVPETQQLVALSASDMPGVQENIIQWCNSQIEKLKYQLNDAEANFEHAKKNKWRSSPFRNLVTKYKNSIVYYEKVKTAIEEGFVIVPNFPVDIFAIRTKAKTPRYDESNYDSWFTQNSQALPQGEGEYKDPNPKTESYIETVDEKKKKVFYPAEFQPDVAFPIAAVKPQVLKVTQKAMALKLFDQIGIVRQQSGRDPIVCGIINNKAKQYHSLTFFIAWFVNYGDI